MMPNFNLFVVSSNLPVNVQGIERVTELFSFTNFVFHFSNAMKWNGMASWLTMHVEISFYLFALCFLCLLNKIYCC